MYESEREKYLSIANSGMAASERGPVEDKESPEELAKRSAGETFMDHLRLRKEGRLEDDLRRNYADDVIIVSNYGTFNGKEGVRESASILLKNLPSLNYKFDSLLVNNSGAAFEEWEGSSDEIEVTDGIDAFIIRDGKIKIQTIWYTSHNKTRPN